MRRTEEIQLKGQQQIIELQRMTAIGQGQTLGDQNVTELVRELRSVMGDGARESDDDPWLDARGNAHECALAGARAAAGLIHL